MSLLSSSAKSKTSNSSDQSYRPNQQKDIGAAQIQISASKKVGLNVSDSRNFSDQRVFSDSSKKNADNYYSDSRSFVDNSNRSVNTKITKTDHGAIQGALNNNYYVVDRAMAAFEKSVSGSVSNMNSAYTGFNNSTEKVHEQLLGNVEQTESGILGMGDSLVKLFLGLAISIIGLVALTRAKGA